jgi:hypothetical protein
MKHPFRRLLGSFPDILLHSMNFANLLSASGHDLGNFAQLLRLARLGIHAAMPIRYEIVLRLMIYSQGRKGRDAAGFFRPFHRRRVVVDFA